jgi:hypothetical protein
MVAWKTCTRPKDLGGLGIPDLKLVATAFEAKWLWLQKVNRDRAWAALPLKMSTEAVAFFRASTHTVVGNGHNTLFWLDSWINGVAVRTLAPTLLQYVSRRNINTLTVATGLANRRWVRQIEGGVSVQATLEYLRVWHVVEAVVLSDTPDRLVWRWQSDGSFSVNSAYLALNHGSHPIPGCVLVWDIWAPARIKMFLWLALRRRHWTADRRLRHGLDAHTNCWLCEQEAESIDHIAVTCSFTRQVWFIVASVLGMQTVPTPDGSLLQWWIAWRQHWTGDLRRGADSLFALITWEVWKERNARCFRGSESDANVLTATIKYQAELWVVAGAKHLGSLLARVVV